MPDSNSKTVAEKVKVAIDTLGLLDEQVPPVAAQFKVREKAVLMQRQDTCPFGIVSYSTDTQQGTRYSAQQQGIIYPIQITLVDAGNKSTQRALGLISKWKEQIRHGFLVQQPRILASLLPTLFQQEVRDAQFLDPRAWGDNYVVLAFFLMIELVEDITA